jgi:hypothetical protein
MKFSVEKVINVYIRPPWVDYTDDLCAIIPVKRPQSSTYHFMLGSIVFPMVLLNSSTQNYEWDRHYFGFNLVQKL